MYTSKKMLLTILTLFVVIFFLFMSLTIYGSLLTAAPFRNSHVDGTEEGRKIAHGVTDGFEIITDANDLLLDQLRTVGLPELLSQPDVASQLPQVLALLADCGVQLGDNPDISQAALQELLSTEAYLAADTGRQMEMLVTAAEQSARDDTAVFQLNGKPERVAIFAPDRQDSAVGAMIEWCAYCKYPYRLFEQFPTAAQLRGYDMLLISRWPSDGIPVAQLQEITGLEMMLVFAQMPDSRAIAADPALMDLFGIEQVRAQALEIEKVHLFGDFYLSEDRIYEPDDDYGETDDIHLTFPYYHLRPGYEVYAVAELPPVDGVPVAADEMPPLLWRTVTGRSRVFCIGAEIFSGDALLGTLSAIAAQATDFYVYPVVNAQTVNLLGFPYMNRENDAVLEEIYGHHADTLTGSVLWPAVVQSTYVYSQYTDFYISACSDYTAPALDTDIMAGYFIRQIQRQLGMMALTLKQQSDVSLDMVLSRNEAFLREYAPQWTFSTVYSGDFPPEALLPHLNDSEGLLGKVSIVMTNPQPGQPLINRLTDQTLQVQLTSWGFRHEALDDLRLLANQTALAMDNQYIDMDRVLYPKAARDHWNELGTIWSSGVTYYHDFSALDDVQTPELARRVALLLALDYTYRREADGIHIQVDGLGEEEEAYFILRLQGMVPGRITGGELTQLTESSYLVRIRQPEVIIEEKPRFSLGMP